MPVYCLSPSAPVGGVSVRAPPPSLGRSSNSSVADFAAYINPLPLMDGQRGGIAPARAAFLPSELNFIVKLCHHPAGYMFDAAARLPLGELALPLVTFKESDHRRVQASGQRFKSVVRDGVGFFHVGFFYSQNADLLKKYLCGRPVKVARMIIIADLFDFVNVLPIRQVIKYIL